MLQSASNWMNMSTQQPSQICAPSCKLLPEEAMAISHRFPVWTGSVQRGWPEASLFLFYALLCYFHQECWWCTCSCSWEDLGCTTSSCVLDVMTTKRKGYLAYTQFTGPRQHRPQLGAELQGREQEDNAAGVFPAGLGTRDTKGGTC